MDRRIVIIDGHPDPSAKCYCHALAEAYAKGARDGGHEVRRIDLAGLEVPILRSRREWAEKPPADAIREAQETISWADHLVFVYPLWLGAMPALLKAFCEQVFRPGFAVPADAQSMDAGLLKGRSAHIVVTMGMPAGVYRWFYRAHSLKSFERNILRFCGIGPIRESLLGGIETASDNQRRRWLEGMRSLGRDGR